MQSFALPLGYGADGAVDEIRTRDIHLGKVALYQLSYYRKLLVRVKRLELIRLRQQILNLPRLPFRHTRLKEGDPLGIRTPGTLIKSQVLYRLS